MTEFNVVREQIDSAIRDWNFKLAELLYNNFIISYSQQLNEEYNIFLNAIGRLDSGDEKSIKINKLIAQNSKDLKEYYNIILDIHKNMNINSLSQCYCISKIIDLFYNTKNFFTYTNNDQFKNFHQNAIMEILCFFSSKYTGARRYYCIFIKSYRELVYVQKNTKIAVCIGGILRGNWRESINSIIDVFSKSFNADFFLFTWDMMQLWPGLGGGGNWCSRLLNKELSSKAPQEISSNHLLSVNFPNIYAKISKEVLLKLDCDDLTFLQKNTAIKKYCIEDQLSALRDFPENMNIRIYYIGWKLKQMLEEYEKKNNILYDFVIFIRPDADVLKCDLSDLLKLEFNEVADFHRLWGNVTWFTYGRRNSMLTYWSLLDYFFYMKKNISNFTFNCHNLFNSWGILNNIVIKKRDIIVDIRNSKALQGLVFPNIELEITQDLKNLKHKGFSCKDIALFKDFFCLVSEGLKDRNGLLIKKFHSEYGTAKTRIQNQLSYKLGQAMIANSKSILGYIRMPFVLSYIKDKHKQEQKIYQEKIKKDSSLTLPPLEQYPDYQEALKLKNHLSYKLGKALIQANKTWYRGGYIKLWFEIGKIRKEQFR
ncbi:hypothetical protein [Campylobacter jejuni]|uniref:hypothetical protein n=1 Tax=Campylobacter jejuni TaxID=197 RepID=UPI000F80B511|nr:hypothetical protein [Campylobacter jejuni]RTJ70573.1 hypothetical protein C3H60_05625 [Campylobacter jejuni]